MMATVVSHCEKKVLPRPCRVLDTFANRIEGNQRKPSAAHERLLRLNQIAISQMKLLIEDKGIDKLERTNKP